MPMNPAPQLTITEIESKVESSTDDETWFIFCPREVYFIAHLFVLKSEDLLTFTNAKAHHDHQ